MLSFRSASVRTAEPASAKIRAQTVRRSPTSLAESMRGGFVRSGTVRRGPSTSGRKSRVGEMVKRKGKHPGNAPSSIQVRDENRPDRTTDGDCLCLVVDGNGARRREPRTTANRRHRDFGLGRESATPPAQEREAAVACVQFSRRPLNERVSQRMCRSAHPLPTIAPSV